MMTPSEFRRKNPDLTDGALALAYAMYSAREETENWQVVLLGYAEPILIGIDLASDAS